MANHCIRSEQQDISVRVYCGQYGNPTPCSHPARSTVEMTGDDDVDMQNLFQIKNLKDPVNDGDAASKSYVDLKVASIIPKPNINLLKSSGCAGNSNGQNVFRYFGPGAILPKDSKIGKVSLSTAILSGAPVTHTLKMFTVAHPFTGSAKSRVILEKPSTKTHETVTLSPWEILSKESSVFFTLETSSPSGTAPVYTGQSTLIIHVEY